MIIVSDTSAITSLLQIGQAGILRQLYREVVVPTEVAAELRKFHSTLPDYLQVLSVSDQLHFQKFCAEVDPGEAAALTLMIEGKGDLLLIDERRGRAIAAREGINVIGLIGVLIEGRRKNLIPSIAVVLHRLETEAGFRISTTLKDRAIKAVGE